MADYSANLTPIYRISKFLDRLVHGTDAPEPIFRIEFYLAKLAGQDVEIAAQYAAGTPVIVWFPLAEPYTESLTPQALRTQDGTTVVSSSAGSVGATVEYKASQEPNAANTASGLMMAAPSGEDGGAADGS